ncbi:uncharacterized protein PGTG_13507 [Puccinia graminis f. sp. tritici CRL 75-36-700-3]|uniref:Uncharacterized protein n=1 Tax=Puccinia graminis f. sp. tritici (strain CRL 75-36-700-3 / race SCCL) TaxID=418459 RepID=E3KTL4_PUCGT|nr:uncharacterized protein PGTG_13507 [Puccinia graminis f. sp. tritici CRL 75-36-700-3]EFP87721.2 hypothetical protein PGTG_13507 [Puccinia graminis f. sp. tritici CRL 75-36-700-3]
MRQFLGIGFSLALLLVTVAASRIVPGGRQACAPNCVPPASNKPAGAKLPCRPSEGCRGAGGAGGGSGGGSGTGGGRYMAGN